MPFRTERTIVSRKERWGESKFKPNSLRRTLMAQGRRPPSLGGEGGNSDLGFKFRGQDQ